MIFVKFYVDSNSASGANISIKNWNILMTTMTNIRSIMKKQSNASHDQSNEKHSSLKKVIQAADKKLEASKIIEAKAIAEEIQNRLEEDIAKEINIEFNSGLNKNTKPPVSVDINGKQIGTSIKQNESTHILELHRKQIEIQDLHHEIQKNSSALEQLVNKSVNISDYLVKSEIELSRLEDVEKKYIKLQTASETLAKEYRELKLKLDEKYKQINILEGQKIKTRDILSKSQLEINSFNEQIKAQAAEMESQKVVLSKLKDENSNVIEKNKSLEHDLSNLLTFNNELKEKLKASHTEITNNEKSLSKSELKINTLTNENEQLSLDNQDIQTRYKSLSDHNAETISLLEEAQHELKSNNKSAEEKLRLKDARILKMERQLKVLTRQLSLTEQMATESQDAAKTNLDLKLHKNNKVQCKNNKYQTKAPVIEMPKDVLAAAL